MSVDPERDNKDVLADYVTYFNPEFIGVSGETEQLQALAKPFGIYFSAEKEATVGTQNNYQVNHSVSMLVIDPGARLRAIISPPHKANDIAESFTRISRAFSE